jgi:hypothetical protein
MNTVVLENGTVHKPCMYSTTSLGMSDDGFMVYSRYEVLYIALTGNYLTYTVLMYFSSQKQASLSDSDDFCPDSDPTLQIVQIRIITYMKLFNINNF